MAQSILQDHYELAGHLWITFATARPDQLMMDARLRQLLLQHLRIVVPGQLKKAFSQNRQGGEASLQALKSSMQIRWLGHRPR